MIATPPPDAAAGAAAAAPLRVLVVEDEALLAMQIEQLLLEAGHEPVGLAMETGEALQIARESRPDLALVDIHLRDGLTGPEIMRRLTREHGAAGLFLTANRRLVPEDFAGAVGVIAKPFSENAFLQALGFVAWHLREGGGRLARRTPPSLELAPGGARLGGAAGASGGWAVP
jgi:two-component system, response regulator PdtaR